MTRLAPSATTRPSLPPSSPLPLPASRTPFPRPPTTESCNPQSLFVVCWKLLLPCPPRSPALTPPTPRLTRSLSPAFPRLRAAIRSLSSWSAGRLRRPSRSLAHHNTPLPPLVGPQVILHRYANHSIPPSHSTSPPPTLSLVPYAHRRRPIWARRCA